MNRVYGSRKRMLASDDGEDSVDKCRERRRRRMAMRRVAVRPPAKKTADNPTTSSPEIMNLISNMETPPPPVYGTMSVIGRQRQMMDEVSVETNLCRPEINGFQPVHFFGVFDGHVSALCKEHMHVIMKEELMRVKMVGDESNGGWERWRSAVNRSFSRMDEMSLKQCNSRICRCNPQLSLMGSTAVVSVLTKECILVAKCGDSSAVICRDGRPVDLKADVGGCGGRIMSRPIDEIGFWATSEPEISITKRESRILGSNGLWDVVSSETACKTVHESLGENSSEGTELASTLLEC
ncbi:putative protein phosphatase 2C 75 [Bidens hawaiensis]|uniref:putative protein phosphatase 2C 75 n=1 Tax=Bidens hawaiensis TaxID=980011 RepID=UPI0040494041